MTEHAEPGLHGLVDQVASGDPAALPELLERCLPDLDAYVQRHTGALLARQESRSDLVQSVCREVLEDLAGGGFEWRGEGPFRQWLYRAALHKIQGKARYHGALRRDDDRREPLLEGDDPPQREPRTPSMSAIAAEERERFREAMQQLPPQQRRLVEWSHFEGLTHRTIAERLGVTEAHSRMLLSRALAQLAKNATRGE
ncbi:MAG: sigma-70 family RNA polymerase sigma factor [Planctomycetota bacterium]